MEVLIDFWTTYKGNYPKIIHIDDEKIEQCGSVLEAMDIVMKTIHEEVMNNVGWQFTDVHEATKELSEIVKD